MNTTFQVLCAAALTIAASGVVARDRPGTPNGEKAYACGDQFNQTPAVCVDVNNTASEPVRIEVDVTLNGVRMERGAVGGDVQCPERELHLTDEELKRLPFTRTPGGGYIVTTRQVPYRSCEAARMLLEPTHRVNVKTGKEVLPGDAIVRHKTGDFDPEARVGVPPQGIRLSNVAPQSNYCFRFRTRRVSDDVVSEHWSNWTCAQARALPAKPATPKAFSATFLAAAWNGSSKDKPLTHRVVVRWEATARAGFYEVLKKRFVGGKDRYEETIEVPAEVIAFGGQSVEMCAENISGRTCTSTLFARSNQPGDWMPAEIKGGKEVIREVTAAAQPKLRPTTESNLALPPAGNDFDGDRNGDIVWHNEATGEIQIWFMRGNARIGRANITDGASTARIGPPWSIAASNDFNGDGLADLLWYNASTGETQVWFMDGSRLSSRATVVNESGQPFLVGPPWHNVAARDMNRDGRADIVWHNRQTGALQVWVMERQRAATEGLRVIHRAALMADSGMLTLATPPAAIYDMDGDGSPDLVVRDGNTVQILFMQGLKVARRSAVRMGNGGGLPLGSSWSITGANDYDRDGSGDLLLHDAASGETRQWLMLRGEVVAETRALDAQRDGGGALVGLPWRQMNQ
jgi:hypothetical protein